MSSDDNNIDGEWARALANPDNMIMSDSLMTRLGETLEEPSESVDTFVQCSIISTEGDVVSGRTSGFQQSDNERSVSFETTHNTANSMLWFGDVKEVIFSLPSDKEEVIWTVADKEEVIKKTEFFAQNDALITIVITSVKDDDDSNSYTVTMEA